MAIGDSLNLPKKEKEEKPGQVEIGDGANIPKFEAEEKLKKEALEEILAEINYFENKIEEVKETINKEYLKELRENIDEIKFLIGSGGLKYINAEIVRSKFNEMKQKFTEQSDKELDKN